MSGKSLLHYFKPKVVPPTTPTVTTEEVENDACTDVVELELVEEQKDSKPSPERTPADSPPVRRSTRASANRAREAWNDQNDTSSSDDDGDFVRGSRKRARQSNKRSSSSKQTRLSKNGTLICKKDQENNNSKKKVKLDPEREAFLRSGVPDVIEKARTKTSENGCSKNKNDEANEKARETKRRQLDAATLEFLHSGVPESVLKAQQTVDKQKEEDDFLMTMGFFPKTSHVFNYDSFSNTGDELKQEEEKNTKEKEQIRFKISGETGIPSDAESSFSYEDFTGLTTPDITCLSSQDSGIMTPVGLCCGDTPIKVSTPESSVRLSRSHPKKNEETQNDRRPWIDQMRVTNVKNLVVDKNAMETLTRWLKQWKLDIKDDGGTSRKQEQKKKRGNSSDSDFITSDEEESEMKKKSVLLTGPSGCAKTASVYVLAKHLGFEVVEVNFSSRRSGKEVLQRVEEAVLSHRLKSSNNCLLLFKDIDLLHPEEDEGFFSAVAQLITTAVRPIVMTSSLPSYCSIDSKLDKKDPLRISFALPKPREIVEKILKPILCSTNSIAESDGSDQVDWWLDSIVRHSGCDIRQSINQLQLLLSTSATSSDFTRLSNADIHLHSSPFQPHLVDLNFPRQSLLPYPESKADSQPDDEEDEVNMSLSARKKRCISQLDGLGDCLELFGDLDYISRLSSSCPTRNVNVFGDIEEATWYWNHVSGMRSTFFTRLSTLLEAQRKKEEGVPKLDLKWIRELVLESDAEIDKWMEIDGMNDEIGQYCDRSISTGGIDWESCAAVRTIVKNNILDSAAGRVQKRHGRMASYFNRLDKRLVANIQGTLDFQEKLDSVKLYS